MSGTTPELVIWQALVSGELDALVEAASALPPGAPSPASVASLRRLGSPEQVRLALDWCRARRGIERKFPGAPWMVGDSSGVELASGELVAAHKAARLTSAAPEGVFDLGSGIGADTIALARHVPVQAIDRSEVRAWMTEENARRAGEGLRKVDVRTGSIEDLAELPLPFHLDPARRQERLGSREGRRSVSLVDHEPPPEEIRRLLALQPTALLKLAPGLDRDELARELPAASEGELEFVEERGQLVQALAWTGELAGEDGLRRATLLPENRTVAGTGEEELESADGESEALLFVPRPSLERANLVATVAGDGARELWPGLGIVTSDDPLDSDWFAGFRVVASRGWHVKKVARELASRGAGRVRVRTRGKAVAAQELEKKLSGSGEREFTVFVFRLDRKLRAWITERTD